MPIYGYRCQACEQEFDVTQRMSDAAQAACPSCGGAGTRLFFPAGILFKGSGFYKTDSRSTSTATAGAAETAKSSTNGSADSSKVTKDTGTPSPPAKTSTPGDSGSGSGSTPAPSKA